MRATIEILDIKQLRMAPVNLFAYTQNLSVELAKLPRSGGMGPESEFRPSSSVVSAVRLPSSGGMGPESAFPTKDKIVRAVRLPSSDGMIFMIIL